MDISRRLMLMSAPGLALGAAISPAVGASPPPPSVFVTDLGLKPNSSKDQSKAFRSALDTAAKYGAGVVVPAGKYIVRGLKIDQSIQIIGIPGRTTLVSPKGPVFVLDNAASITFSGLTFEGPGTGTADQSREGLINAGRCDDLVIENCMFRNGANSGLSLIECSGRVTGNRFQSMTQAGIFSLDAKGLEISGNHVRDIDNNGIQVWTSDQREDGTIVSGNRIERVAAKAGGSGQNGNGINVFRAGNVLIANNRISDCAFSAIRNNSGQNCQIVNNSCSRLGETALYVEFAFDGAIVSGNLIGDSVSGISITNFREGGRLAVCSNNIIRRLTGAQSRPDARAVGISAEADTIVTGNVIEDSADIGISLGWGPYCRNLQATNNLVRRCGIGMAASLTADAGAVLISGNMIASSTRAAILGMDHDKIITEDLAKPGAQSYGALTVRDNLIA